MVLLLTRVNAEGIKHSPLHRPIRNAFLVTCRFLAMTMNYVVCIIMKIFLIRYRGGGPAGTQVVEKEMVDSKHNIILTHQTFVNISLL
jgi:hypothetical protein